jgi:hypothetical protein
LCVCFFRFSSAHLLLELLSNILLLPTSTATPAQSSPNTSSEAPQLLSGADAKALVSQIVAFTRSPLLQGNALASLIRLCQTLVKTQGDASKTGLGFSRLLGSLTASASEGKIPAANLPSLSRCVVAMSQEERRRGGKGVEAAMRQFLSSLETKETDVHARHLALLVIGEHCKSQTKAMDPPEASDTGNMQMKLVSSLAEGSDTVQAAAAYALGGFTTRNLAVRLPKLLKLISTAGSSATTNRRYLLLSALREAIDCHLGSKELLARFKPHVDHVTPVLIANSDAKEEGVVHAGLCFGGGGIRALTIERKHAFVRASIA